MSVQIRSARLLACLLAAGFVALLACQSAQATIISITETGGDAAITTIVAPVAFGEDVDTFVDRTHEHNGARINDATGLLTTSEAAGTTAVPLPSYLVGAEYIMNGNNNRDNNPYSLTVNVDTPSFVYLLIDNRLIRLF